MSSAGARARGDAWPRECSGGTTRRRRRARRGGHSFASEGENTASGECAAGCLKYPPASSLCDSGRKYPQYGAQGENTTVTGGPMAACPASQMRPTAGTQCEGGRTSRGPWGARRLGKARGPEAEGGSGRGTARAALRRGGVVARPSSSAAFSD
jgi:hypothetical protein